MGSTTSIPVPLTASPSRVFLTTRYSQPLARNSLRILVSASTVRPRKSTRTRLCALASLSLRVFTRESFSTRSTGISPARLGFQRRQQRRRINLDARAHGGGQGHRPDVGALRR